MSGAAAPVAQEWFDFVRLVRRAQSRLERRLVRIHADLDRLAEAERGVWIGQLLMAQARSLRRGTPMARVTDYATGAQIEVVLAPSTTAVEHATRLFSEARRLRRGEPMMRRREGEARERLRALDAWLDRAAAVGDAPDAEQRAELLGRATSLGVVAPPAPARLDRETDLPRRPFQRYRGDKSRLILVGRGGADNDLLTTRVARPQDLWLHVKGRTGAHVVVPLARGEACPPEVLVDAATLAAHHSEARGEATSEISYALRRYVQKRRKSAPGAVILLREKVLWVRIEPDRLERLLASKE